MVVTDDGIVTLLNRLKRNAPLPMLITESGIVIFVNSLFSNAP